MKGVLVLLVCCVGYACVANGQQFLCEALDTVAECRTRLEGKLSGVDASAAQMKLEASQDSVKKKTETGLSELPTGLSSSVKDFLPLLQFGGVLGNVNSNDNTGVVTVALNTPFVGAGRLTKDYAFQLKGLIETKPKLFDPIAQRLPKANRDALEKELLATPNRQNVTLQFSTNLTTKRLGRNFEQYQKVLDDLFLGLFAQGSKIVASETKEIEFERALNRLERTNEQIDVFEHTRMFEIPPQVAKTAAERRQEIELAIFHVAENEIARAAAFDAGIKGSGLYLFGQLVNNQPQMNFTISRVFRDPLFGPKQLSGRVTYELGWGNNVNAFLDSAGAACQTYSSPACVAALKAFTASAETKAAIKAGARIALYGEFTTNDRYSYQLSDQNISLLYDNATKASVGADFGRLIGVEDDGAASARIDGSIRGDWSSDQTLSKNRFVASITLTKKFGDISIPIGLRYASKTEFLSDFDHGITANVGLKFNLFPGIK